MSKIITKRQLNTLIESTLKEYVRDEDAIYAMPGGEELMNDLDQDYNPNSPSEHHRNLDRKNQEYEEWKKQNSTKNGGMTQKDIDSALKHVDYMKDAMCECGGAMYEGTCNECGSTGGYMGEGKKEIKNPGKYMGKAKQKAGVDDDGDGLYALNFLCDGDSKSSSSGLL